MCKPKRGYVMASGYARANERSEAVMFLRQPRRPREISQTIFSTLRSSANQDLIRFDAGSLRSCEQIPSPWNEDGGSFSRFF